MREFKLINDIGIEFDLMRKDAFFHDPSELGFDRTINTMRSGSSYLETDSYYEQKTPSGKISFDGYAPFDEFVSFLGSGDMLTFCYKPLNRWYKAHCKVTSLTKDELDTYGRLESSITFTFFTSWYESLIYSKRTVPTEEGKVYDYTYPYSYVDTNTALMEIENGSFESPTILTIFGPVTDPYWVLTQNGQTLYTGKMDVTIPDGHKLVVDSNPDHMEIAEYTSNNEWIQSLYEYSDYSTERFIYVPPGKSKFAVTSDGGLSISAYLEVDKVANAV